MSAWTGRCEQKQCGDPAPNHEETSLLQKRRDARSNRNVNADDEVEAALSMTAGTNKIWQVLLDEPATFLDSIEEKSISEARNFGMEVNVSSITSVSSNKVSFEPASELYNPWKFCPLKSHAERVQAANTVGGFTMKVVQLFNEFNIWIWSDGEDRPINPATDSELLRSGPFGSSNLFPSWADLRSAGLMFTLLPTLIATDSGNRTTWFNQAAKKTCWEPNPLALGPMIFKYSMVQPALTDPDQKRGYYTATAPQNPDFFDREAPLFIDGLRHASFRGLLELAGFARRYPVDVSLANAIPRLAGNAPDEQAIAKYVGPLVMTSIWGERPSSEATEAMLTYARYGKYAIFGDEIHKFALGPTGIAAKIKAASDAVSEWAGETKFSKLLLKAREHHAPGNPWFAKKERLISDMTLATLFAGLVGTTDMAKKCVVYQKRDLAHERLFKENPEKYLIELMRFDSAVTSVTELLQQQTNMNLEGRNLTLSEGTPAQLVLATANRDPTHWFEPDAFNPGRTDLADTLSWNGKVVDVEARDLERAPRFCPGYCLSLKVGAAVCAAQMGSFDELLAAGKILANGGEVKCNNFGSGELPPLWDPANTTLPNEHKSDLSSGEVLVQKGKSCNSPEYYIDRFDSVDLCSYAVKAAGGKFFKYGSGWLQSGHCYIEYTSSSSCPEGFVDDSFDFYDIPEIPLGEALYNKVNIFQVSVAPQNPSSGIMRGPQLESGPVVLAQRTGKASHLVSLVVDKFCDSEYLLRIHAGAAVIETLEACCDAPWGRPSIWSVRRRRRSCKPPATRSVASWKTLERTGDEWHVCREPEDTAFSAKPPSQPGLPDVANGDCVYGQVAAQSITFREVINKCSSLISLAVPGLANVAEWSYKFHHTLFPDTAHNHFIAWVLGKDADSSSLAPGTFGQFTIGMFTAVVHLQLRPFKGSNLPASLRIPIPQTQKFLDRYRIFNFIGMPLEDIDGNMRSRLTENQACVIDTIRELPVDDGLDGKKNTWEVLLGQDPTEPSSCPDGRDKCTKKDFVRGAFDKYVTKDGDPVYPAEVINFRERWLVNGEWADQAETYLAWSHWATHRIEAVNMDGAAFVVRTNDLSKLDIRPGFATIGADMYFDSSGAPVMIETPLGQKLWRADVDSVTWQYWKFAWRSSAFLKVTLVDHLWATHFTAANAMGAAARESLSPLHPLRRLLSMFTYGTVDVNDNAFHQLLGPKALLQRSTPFHDFYDVANAAKKMIPPLKKYFELFVSEEAKQKLPKELLKTPYVEDGQLLFNALKKLTDDFFAVYDGTWCPAGSLIDPEIRFFFRQLQTWSMGQQHMFTDGPFLGMFGADGTTLRCEGVKLWFAINFFQVTGYHRHVGTVADTAADPDFAGFGWKKGEAFTRPRQAIQLSLISAYTATKWPKLIDDYSFLAMGIDKSAEAANVFKTFKSEMDQLKQVIDQRNKDRSIPYMEMHPERVECSLAV